MLSARRDGDLLMELPKNSVVSIVAGVSFSEIAQLLERIHKGFPYASFEQLEAQYQLPRKQLLALIGLSTSTAQRRKKLGKMSVPESENIARYARLLDVALSLMEGNHKRALHWLTTPARALGGETPLAYAATAIGAQHVENLIGRIEYGVIS